MPSSESVESVRVVMHTVIMLIVECVVHCVNASMKQSQKIS